MYSSSEDKHTETVNCLPSNVKRTKKKDYKVLSIAGEAYLKWLIQTKALNTYLAGNTLPMETFEMIRRLSWHSRARMPKQI